MAIKNLITIGALFVLCIGPNVAVGQINVPGPVFKHQQVETTEATRPFATPGIFNYDAQMFAPLQFPMTPGEELGPRTGFFASMDRLYLSMTRARGDDTTTNEVPVGTNYMWGNKYKAGWMTEAQDGWSFEYSQSEGSFYSSGQDILAGNPMLTSTRFANVEVNKVFRQRLSRGGWLQPYLGIRFINLGDKTIEDVSLPADVSLRFKQSVTNNAFGFNVGSSYINRKGRYRNEFDIALATTYNNQNYFATDLTFSGTGNTVLESYYTGNSFVPVLDLSYELAYNLTRDFGIRGGAQFMWLWDGIARANTLTQPQNPNSEFSQTLGEPGIFEQGVIAAGFSFGMEWKR